MKIKDIALDELARAKEVEGVTDKRKEKDEVPDLTFGLENAELFTESDREKLVLSLHDNKLSDVAFSDPYSENTRKIRRNLLFASVGCLAASTLELKVSSIVGLSTGKSQIPLDSLLGLFSIGIAYYIVAFTAFMLIDLYSWRVETEIVRLQPYNKFLDQVEKRLGKLQAFSQFYDFTINKRKDDFYSKYNEDEESRFLEAQFFLEKNLDKLNAVNNEMVSNIYPFLQDIKRVSSIISLTNRRFVLRLLALAVIDILLPLSLGIVAFIHSMPYLPNFIDILWTKL
ncbi:hypothetical protein [Vibrio parahaemolyticus]|uniref:hypothetical protein n=1 Tax=Vibrio parahaemolyticus TaxID=670 RepID=UPI0008133A18|nr:hypothetical protein [Vibrio parahaemolyticus]EGR1569776.1 hypothetical protein [Vibrio parahaemolyticus]EJC6860315.1 hypothetical protein [Vibrio parahaemolyticus]EJC7971312.1 hypothetical protein [Vibrio parahaemolyticus]EKN4584205.1 hypothetical protein [Vibrio parahaemolyticus]MDF4340729.1 hypothetical protein [Vibrio parahaemolyticus]